MKPGVPIGREQLAENLRTSIQAWRSGLCSFNALLMCEQNDGGEPRYVYYSETDSDGCLATALPERDDPVRVVTAYDLDPAQKAKLARLRWGKS